MITKAVLLAAGRGSRLGALTADTPKPLLAAAGRPIIVHILEGLRRAGIEEITVVTGYLGDVLERELGNGEASGLHLRYVRQTELDGTARALALARDWLGDERFFAGWGDILVRPENYRRVVRAAHLADAAIAVNEVDDPWAGAAVYLDDSNVVQRIVEKPPKGTSTTRWNNAGLSVLGPAIWPEIDRLEVSERGEYELPRAVAALVVSGARVVAVPVEGEWFDIGTAEDLERARVGYGESPRSRASL